MKIDLARSAGFCFGVKRAIAIALEAARRHKNVVMLGDIVHNEAVVRRIRKEGIKKVPRLSPGRGKILLIRAHGTTAKTIESARGLGYTIIDATCPMVKEIHKTALAYEDKGYTVMVIGDKEHDEVNGIVGQLKKKSMVIDTPKRLPLTQISKIKKACVVVQSTQNLDNALAIVKILKRHIKHVRFFNTICQPTRIKQAEIKTMPLANDVMIIIGSKSSANTRRLYQLSNSLNNRSFWIQSFRDIKPAWFKNARSVGITAGASTPDEATAKVIEYIKKISARLNCR